jgi:methyl-accepting chemotaxis protein
MKRTWRRRNYFIKKDLQGKYIFIFFIFVIAGSYLFTVIFGLTSLDSLTIVYKDHNLQLGKTPVVLLKELLRAHWIFIVTSGVLVMFASMFLTHRFAGPLYRFEKSVEEMTRGNFNFDIRLRSTDEAKELAEMLNGFNTGISSLLREARELADTMGGHLEAAHSTAAGADSAKEVEKALALHGTLRDILHRFILKNDG